MNVGVSGRTGSGLSATYLPLNPFTAMTMGRTSVPSSALSGVSGSLTGGTGGMSLSELLRMQREENAKTYQENLGRWQGIEQGLMGVPQKLAADPLMQGARGLASGLVANPEAINDQTQQLMMNRASNLVNAASNTQQGQTRQQLGSMGLLGGSAESAAMGQIGRNRQAQLADTATQLEIERAMRRNQDIQSAAALAGGLAGQQSGAEQFAQGTRAQTAPYFTPESLAGYAGFFAGQGGGSLFGNGGMSTGQTNNQASPFGFSTGALNAGAGGMSPGQTGISTYNYNNPNGFGGYQYSNPSYFDNTNYTSYAQQGGGSQFDSLLKEFLANNPAIS